MNYLIPFENCIDVEILNLIEQGKLRTFAIIPFVTGQLDMFESSRKGSDMIYQYLTWENNELKYTYRNEKSLKPNFPSIHQGTAHGEITLLEERRLIESQQQNFYTDI